MSSLSVRNKIKNFITSNIPEESKVVDLTAEFDYLDKLLERNGISHSNKSWLGLEFIGGDEEPITVPATNNSGKYREGGAIYLHVVGRAALGVGSSLVARAEIIRSRFRGQNINGLRVQTITTLNTNAGATLQFENGWVAGSILIGYEHDVAL